MYGVGVGKQGDFFDQIVKLDVAAGLSDVWRSPGVFPGEPVFVAAPSGDTEDDGVLLSVVLDTDRKRSFLLILNAKDLREIGRAEAPYPIPFGFHGQHFC